MERNDDLLNNNLPHALDIFEELRAATSTDAQLIALAIVVMSTQILNQLRMLGSALDGLAETVANK